MSTPDDAFPTLQEIVACPALPSLPTVAMQVLELTRNEDVRIDEIADVVQNDPALAAKILKTVNSSFYALSTPCPTIARALTFLGLNTVKSLVLGFSLAKISEGTDDVMRREYWRRCLYAAASSRRLCQIAGGCDAEEVFSAAIMQDLGMLALHTKCGEQYATLIRTADHHRRLPAAERAAMGFDHTEVGASLGSRWRLPGQLIEAIRHHHDGSAGVYDQIVQLVWLGSEVATALDEPNAGRRCEEVRAVVNPTLTLTADAVKTLVEGIDDDVKELSKLFEVDTSVAPDVNTLMAEREEAAVRHQLAQQRETESLRRTADELARQATTDALTSVGNRKRFDDELTTRFDQASAFKGTLGLVLIDADRFKLLNDTHGHQAGDAVLVELAARLADAVRGVDLVCRYGGEEFAAILPGASIKDVATIAERLRRSIADRAFDLSGVPGVPAELNVTVSLGAVVYDTDSARVLTTAGLLVQAADKALYAAKDGGRNCVRVFRPGGRTAAA
ncbi:MAG: GGDEF domain-containing protein [Phycisphaerales bacterium]|nr:GGDEF domain-containing protein [Phycisphaerae bacterium]NNM25885.1 GGDEF domain-containing protein [Phycisphaerales bacterium]